MAFVYTMIDNIPKTKQWLNFEREVAVINYNNVIITISTCMISDYFDRAQNKFGLLPIVLIS